MYVRQTAISKSKLAMLSHQLFDLRFLVRLLSLHKDFDVRVLALEMLDQASHDLFRLAISYQ